MDFSTYPYLRRALDLIGNVSLEDLFSSRRLELARVRGKERVLQALRGRIERKGNGMTELLSYPFARAIVSHIGSPYLIRRFALAESKFAYENMLQEREEDLAEIGNEVGIKSVLEGRIFRVHFSDYVEIAANLGGRWKLVNRFLEKGYVSLVKEEFARALQEKIRERILSSLPARIPHNLRPLIEPYCTEIRKELSKVERRGEIKLGKIRMEFFPPCMRKLIDDVPVGLPHHGRFALTSFLWNIGAREDDLIKIFSQSPDFDEAKAKYQVEHIGGLIGSKKYTPPSCDTMRSYQLCHGADELCSTVKHPLTYYRKKLFGSK